MDAKKLFRWIGLYALNLLAATLGVMFGAEVFAEVSLAPIMGHQNFLAAVLKPPYPLLIALGILAGYLSQLRWKGSQALWVWNPHSRARVPAPHGSSRASKKSSTLARISGAFLDS